MLPVPVLDDEEFDIIMDEARSLIAAWYPDWTDYNYHDPGITLIEMFSWLKESQQFYLDQIGAEARRKYLKLLGFWPAEREAARVVVRVEPEEDAVILSGTRLLAGNLVFEPEEKKQLVGGGIVRCITWDGKTLEYPERAGRLGLLPFGYYPITDNSFYLQVQSAPPVGQILNLWLEIAPPYGRERNPAANALPFPLAGLRVQYYHAGAWRDADSVRDGTMGGLFSGFLDFAVGEKMDGKGPFSGKQGALDGYFIRIVLLDAQYDAPPVLDGISLNALPLRQRNTVLEQRLLPIEKTQNGGAACRAGTMAVLNGKNELYLYWEESGLRHCTRLDRFEKNSNFETGETVFLFSFPAAFPDRVREAEAPAALVLSFAPENAGKRLVAVGNGFPSQSCELEFGDVEYEKFSLMIREKAGTGDFIIWDKVRDFSCSGPEDRHYILDQKAGKIHFGDCVHGMAPRGEILVSACSETAGSGGNVKAGAIDRFEGMGPEEIRLWNPRSASGGRDAEGLEECFERAREELLTPAAAVSHEDYERLVLKTPGLLIESCRVISPSPEERQKRGLAGNEIFIVVKPCSAGGRAELNGRYRKNISAYLLPFCPAGQKLCLLSPQYVFFDIYGELTVRAEYRDAKTLVERAVEQYFDRLKNEFGAEVSYSGLYGCLDQLDCLSRIRTLTMEAKGGGWKKSRDGTIRLAQSGLAGLGQARFALSEED